METSKKCFFELHRDGADFPLTFNSNPIPMIPFSSILPISIDLLQLLACSIQPAGDNRNLATNIIATSIGYSLHSN